MGVPCSLSCLGSQRPPLRQMRSGSGRPSIFFLSLPRQGPRDKAPSGLLTSAAPGFLHRLSFLPRRLDLPEPGLTDPSCSGGHTSMVTSSQRPRTPPPSVVQLLLIKGRSLGTHLSGQGACCFGHSSALAPTPHHGGSVLTHHSAARSRGRCGRVMFTPLRTRHAPSPLN